MTSTYDKVLNAPDRETRKEALDALCLEKVAKGMESCVYFVMGVPQHVGETIPSFRKTLVDVIRQEAAELEDV